MITYIETVEELQEHLKDDKRIIFKLGKDACPPCAMLDRLLVEIADEHPEYTILKAHWPDWDSMRGDLLLKHMSEVSIDQFGRDFKGFPFTFLISEGEYKDYISGFGKWIGEEIVTFMEIGRLPNEEVESEEVNEGEEE